MLHQHEEKIKDLFKNSKSSEKIVDNVDNWKENAQRNLKIKKNLKTQAEVKTIAKKTIFEKKDRAVTLYLVEDD